MRMADSWLPDLWPGKALSSIDISWQQDSAHNRCCCRAAYAAKLLLLHPHHAYQPATSRALPGSQRVAAQLASKVWSQHTVRRACDRVLINASPGCEEPAVDICGACIAVAASWRPCRSRYPEDGFHRCMLVTMRARRWVCKTADARLLRVSCQYRPHRRQQIINMAVRSHT